MNQGEAYVIPPLHGTERGNNANQTGTPATTSAQEAQVMKTKWLALFPLHIVSCTISWDKIAVIVVVVLACSSLFLAIRHDLPNLYRRQSYLDGSSLKITSVA